MAQPGPVLHFLCGPLTDPRYKQDAMLYVLDTYGSFKTISPPEKPSMGYAQELLASVALLPPDHPHVFVVDLRTAPFMEDLDLLLSSPWKTTKAVVVFSPVYPDSPEFQKYFAAYRTAASLEQDAGCLRTRRVTLAYRLTYHPRACTDVTDAALNGLYTALRNAGLIQDLATLLSTGPP